MTTESKKGGEQEGKEEGKVPPLFVACLGAAALALGGFGEMTCFDMRMFCADDIEMMCVAFSCFHP